MFKKTLLFSVLLLACLALAAAAGEILQARVKVASANIRLKPKIDSLVIGKAALGQVFEVLKTEGDWYLVELPPDEKGTVISGYLHSSVTEIVGAGEAPVRAEPEPEAVDKPKPEKPKPAPRRASVAPRPARRSAAASADKQKKFYVRLGGGYGTNSFDYASAWQFEMYHESGPVSESYKVDASGVAVDVGFGFFFMKTIGVEVSFLPGSGKSAGAFRAEFPHPLYFGQNRVKEWTKDDLSYSSSEVNLDVIGAFPLSRRFTVTAGAGGTYFLSVKIQSLQKIDWAETAYPYLDLSITPVYGDYSKSAFGFNAMAGVDFRVTPTLSANVTGRFSTGTAALDIEGQKVNVKAGGLRATVGLKAAF
jgi:opacity protein-like surface antigen